MTNSTRWRWLARVSWLCAIISVLFLGRAFAQRRASEDPSKAAATVYREATGMEVVMVVIGSSTCAASMSSSLPGIISRIDSSLSKRTDSLGLHYSAIGVAIDHTPQAGMSFLSRFGHLDEVIAGRNWLNSAAITYMWRDSTGGSGLPQVVLVERPIEVDTRNIYVGPDRILARVVGLDSLEAWANDDARWPGNHGAEVPRLSR